MSEISVQFKNQLNGYNKSEVDLLLKKIEGELQQRAATIDAMQQQIAGLEAKLEEATTPATTEAVEKLELYDKLMKKMDGDYTNLLTPAIAKAKAIEEQAEKEYAIRIDQARYAAEGIYTETAERITGVVDTAVNNNMDRIYNLLDEFIYSKTLPGRVNAFVTNCKAVAQKVKEAPAKAAAKVKASIVEKLNAKKAPVEAAE